MSKLSVVEICAGAGGQSLGLHLAGFSHELAVELDPMAATTLQNNLRRIASESGSENPIVAVGDVVDEAVWQPEAHEGVDLLAGGVPCPPFSIAGKQLGSDDERDLFAWAIELAGRVKPKAVMLENVRGLSMPRFAGYRQAVLDRLEDFGYSASWELLHARDYGVPQLRPRTVLVALEAEYAPHFAWPDRAPTQSTVGSTLRDLMASRGWRGASAWARKASEIAPTIVGGSKKHGGADLGPTRAKRSWAQLGVDGLGVADLAPDKDMPAAFVPKLTTEMVARLQGWNGPEYEWTFEGRKTSRYRQIGNAFPPPVARAVGTSIAAALTKSAPTVPPDRIDRHDIIYRALRDRGDFVSLAELAKIAGPGVTNVEIRKRIRHLALDFDLDLNDAKPEPAWRLGSFKAFRGQDDHLRHAAFAAASGRSRIS